MPINWEDFDNNIKNTKYPLILIKQFFSSLEKINDNYATIMLRYIIKNNLNIFIDNPFYVIGKKIVKNIFTFFVNIFVDVKSARSGSGNCIFNADPDPVWPF